MGVPALKDTGYIDKNGKWTGKDGVKSKEDYFSNDKAQLKSFNLYHKQLKGTLRKNKGARELIGTRTPKGTKITLQGLAGAAHLVGIGRLQTAIKNNEDLNAVKDGLGTPAMEYIDLFSGN